jgi:hypothetical protein
MRERQQRQINTLERIGSYLREVVFTNARARHLKEEILAHLARVMELMSENQVAKAEPTRRRFHRRVTKDGLREEQLLPLCRRGRKLVRVHPELTSALKAPHKHASIAEIADAAERVADALTPHIKVLIAAEYPPDCLTKLRDDARELRARAEAAEDARNLLNRSNRALTEELALARSTIDELDAVLQSFDNYERTYEFGWTNANRVGARMGRPTKRKVAARKRAAERNAAREQAPATEMERR